MFDVADVPPLKYDDQLYLAEAVTPAANDVLALTQEMRDFVYQHTSGARTSHQKLMALHWAIKSSSALDMEYDPFGDGNAREVFHRGTANCLGYAHMFVALAREAGLNARYQWMEVRPEWHRIGDRVAVRLHINVQVKMRDGTEYMVDIDPLGRNEVAGARILDDSEALALHHNNLAMMALAEERPAEAWASLVRGIETAPGLSQLWVNLGAIYRHSGQYREAEQAYFQALDVDSGDRSAMNNLVVLYELEGREQEREYWLDRMHRYRERNPYYHASLGDDAMNAQDWDTAYDHYQKAQKLQPDDGQLLYSMGIIQHKRGLDDDAERLIKLAIERASFHVEKARYRIELRSIKEQRAASL
ncbi:MAG: hypothetical protein Cons2KO_27550 [Congregibacter sp.]